ncbi:MAG: DUF2889 domain-containing protein [Gammaproteobacteria bacterium]|nr:DUF2889 domain-containing protein [Gammaproteobacteria bacterium]
MPLPPSAARDLMHNRDIVCRGYRRRDGLWDIEGHIVDTKPFSYDDPLGTEFEAGRPVHGMYIRLTVDDDLLIHEAIAVSDWTPYRHCKLAAPNFSALKGVRIGPGWWREVQTRVGGTRGCTHLGAPAKNALFPRLRRQRRARILRYHLYTAVVRAVLPCTHEKMTIFSRCP